MIRPLLTIACLLCLFVARNEAAPPNVDSKTFRETVRPFLVQHCNDCHGKDLAEADLRLDSLAADFKMRGSAGHWVEVLDRIQLGEMPPEGEPRPNAQTLIQVTDWISGNLQRMRRSAESTSGRVVMRRLTRSEYTNTVQDLLGVEFVDGEGPLEDLPPDGSIQGFDRMSKALTVDPSLMESYIDVASEVADRAVVFRPPAVPTKTMKFDFVDTADSAMSYLLDRRSVEIDGPFLVVMQDGARTFSKLHHPSTGTEIPVTGRYRIRIRAAAEPGQSESQSENKPTKPVFMDVTYGSLGRLKRFRVDATRQKPSVYEFVHTFDAAVPGEFGVRLVDDTAFHRNAKITTEAHRRAEDLFKSGKLKESLQLKSRMRAEGLFDNYTRSSFKEEVIDTSPLPKLLLQWIEVEGPLQSDFPPPSMKRLFPEGLPSEDQQTLPTATAAIQRLLPRAFRRKTTPGELRSIVHLMDDEFKAGGTFEQALETGLTATLCSPNFLYLREADADKPRRLSDWEVASRLSYLLWSSKPDDELFRAAAAGKLLKDPQEIGRQIDRMLDDARVEGFVDGFARQWLKVDEFTRFPPDQRIFPQFYETEFAGLQSDIQEEPLAFFREVLQQDENISAFLSSGWLMLNERLAAYYGIDGVVGEHFRRVPLERAEAWIEHAKERVQNQPAMGQLHVIGPFKSDDPETAFQTRFPPEDSVDLKEPIGKLRWQEKDWADGKIHTVFRDPNSAYYIHRSIKSKIAQDVVLSFGSDDAIAIWVNGQQVLSNYALRAIEPNQDRVRVSLRQGKNDLLIKIVNGEGTGAYYFSSETLPEKVLVALNTPPNDRDPQQLRLLEGLYLAESSTSPRGGLLGMAGVHLWGADGSRTKPVERGKYLLTVLFNDPPPPPPPNAGEVEPNLRGKQLTVRERLELHREQTTCNHCHRRIDPYGLALENFNAIGQWRTQTDGEKPLNQYWGEREKIDPSGVLPSGVEFQNFLEFKRAILGQRNRFARGLTEKLLMYALGRTIEPSDHAMIQRIISKAKEDGMTLRALLKQVASCEAFLTK